MMHISILPSGHLLLNHAEKAEITESPEVSKKITTWFSQGLETGILRLSASKIDLQKVLSERLCK